MAEVPARERAARAGPASFAQRAEGERRPEGRAERDASVVRHRSRPNAPDTAVLAEELGYHRAWFYDSPALYGDVWIAIARTLDRTSGSVSAPRVLVPSLRHVVTTAAAIGSIEAQAPGRLAVAIGSGFRRAMLGKPAVSWQSMREYVTALRALLRGDEAVVAARVQADEPRWRDREAPDRHTLILAVGGPRSLAIASESATASCAPASSPRVSATPI